MSVSADGTKALVWNNYRVYSVHISKPGIAQEGPTVKLESSVDAENSTFQFTSSNQILRLKRDNDG